jgi:hypothetical protein
MTIGSPPAYSEETFFYALPPSRWVYYPLSHGCPVVSLAFTTTPNRCAGYIGYPPDTLIVNPFSYLVL